MHRADPAQVAPVWREPHIVVDACGPASYIAAGFRFHPPQSIHGATVEQKL